jgi:hypothetical protein
VLCRAAKELPGAGKSGMIADWALRPLRSQMLLKWPRKAGASSEIKASAQALNGPTANIAVRPDSIRTGLLCSPHPATPFSSAPPCQWVAGRAGARPDHPILGHRPEHRRLRFGESSNQVPAALPVSGPTTAPYCPQPLDDALAVATERHPPDVILMRLGKDAPLGRQIERSVTIVITPILSGLHHCYARI